MSTISRWIQILSLDSKINFMNDQGLRLKLNVMSQMHFILIISVILNAITCFITNFVICYERIKAANFFKNKKTI